MKKCFAWGAKYHKTSDLDALCESYLHIQCKDKEAEVNPWKMLWIYNDRNKL